MKVKVIHSKPVFRNIKILRVCPVVNLSRHLGIRCVCKDDDTIVVQIGCCEGKQNLKVSGRTLIPFRNVRG
jgi:hypothetical protein